MLFNLPNTITLCRIALIPVIVFLLSQVQGDLFLPQNKELFFWATFFYIIAAASDFIDGYFARRYGSVSVLGKFIDPMADKLLHMAVLVHLAHLKILPVFIVVTLLFREIFINSLRAVAASEGIIISADNYGKHKTLWLGFGLGFLLHVHPLFESYSFSIPTRVPGLIMLGVGFILSVGSGCNYTLGLVRQLKQRGK